MATVMYPSREPDVSVSEKIRKYPGRYEGRHELNMVAHGIAECLLEKVTQQGRRQEATECVASGYIEDWFEPRMLLVAFFSSLTKVRR